MDENNTKNQQKIILEQVSATQLPLERYKYYTMHQLLESLDLKVELLEAMHSLDVLMIWRDEFNANIKVINVNAIAAFHKKYSSLQATAKSPSIHSQNPSRSLGSEKASGLRISEIIDLPLDSNDGFVDIGVGNASEKPSNLVSHFTSHDVAQNTTTTAPPLSKQRSNHLSINRDMGEKQALDDTGMVDPEGAVQYAEQLMTTANSDFRAPLDTQPLYSAH
ncbi:hypothetical protein EAE96_006616 [Botrytis aclada]|nr:hypothetical protein EAE96_006616 [Botrytis aclada]